MSSLSLDRVTIAYTMARTQQRFVAISDVSFTVTSGEFVALIGPSGCGKTSILNAIAGIQTVDRGTVRVDEVEIKGPGRDRAMVFQAPALLPWRTVLGNVAYGLELQGMRRSTAHDRAREYITLVGLAGFEESYPHELSGGMQQRANLARALTVEPKILLFDEPLAALDAQTREEMQWELHRIWMNSHTTALFVTHQIDEAVLLADRVLVMSASPGRIKANIPVALPSPRNRAVRKSSAFVQLVTMVRDMLDSTGDGGSAGADKKVTTHG